MCASGVRRLWSFGSSIRWSERAVIESCEGDGVAWLRSTGFVKNGRDLCRYAVACKLEIVSQFRRNSVLGGADLIFR